MDKDDEQQKRLTAIKTVYPDIDDKIIVELDKDLVKATSDIFEIIAATRSTVATPEQFRSLLLLYVNNNIRGIINEARTQNAVLQK